MITDPHKIAQTIVDGITGTPDDLMSYIDQLIDDGTICLESCKLNEITILEYVDDSVFQCDICGWNFSLDEYHSDGICNNCEEGER